MRGIQLYTHTVLDAANKSRHVGEGAVTSKSHAILHVYLKGTHIGYYTAIFHR